VRQRGGIVAKGRERIPRWGADDDASGGRKRRCAQVDWVGRGRPMKTKIASLGYRNTRVPFENRGGLKGGGKKEGTRKKGKAVRRGRDC